MAKQASKIVKRRPGASRRGGSVAAGGWADGSDPGGEGWAQDGANRTRRKKVTRRATKQR